MFVVDDQDHLHNIIVHGQNQEFDRPDKSDMEYVCVRRNKP